MKRLRLFIPIAALVIIVGQIIVISLSRTPLSENWGSILSIVSMLLLLSIPFINKYEDKLKRNADE